MLLCFSLARASFAQVNFSLRAGGNIATTKHLIAFPKNRLGWYAGAGSYLPFSSRVYLNPELLFSSKGYRYTDLYDDRISVMRLNYLNLPILIGYKIDQRTSLLGGGEIGYLLSASNVVNSRNDNATASFPKRFEMGPAIGLQYHLLKNVAIEARYIYGIGTFYQTDAVGVRRSKSWAANRTFQLGFNYYLHNK